MNWSAQPKGLPGQGSTRKPLCCFAQPQGSQKTKNSVCLCCLEKETCRVPFFFLVLSASICSITDRIADASNIVSSGQSQWVLKYETAKLPVFWSWNRKCGCIFREDDYNRMFQVSSCSIQTRPETSWHWRWKVEILPWFNSFVLFLLILWW